MNIYVLSAYNYNGYSYDGLEISKQEYFATYDLAENFANDNGYTIRNNPTECGHCVIEQVQVKGF